MLVADGVRLPLESAAAAVRHGHRADVVRHHAHSRCTRGTGRSSSRCCSGATLGMSLMASTSNLLMVFMAVELASLPSYVLAGFRKTHRVGAEASAEVRPVRGGRQRDHGLRPVAALRPLRHAPLYRRPAAGSGPAALAEALAAGGPSALLAVAVFGLIVRARVQDRGGAVPLLVPRRVRGGEHRRDGVPLGRQQGRGAGAAAAGAGGDRRRRRATRRTGSH